MAYIDFNNAFAHAAPVSVATETAAAHDDGHFSPLEWTTIALAQRDSLSSLGEPGRVSRALGSLFGIGTQSKLADPRLEALRRFAVHAWHWGYTLPVSEMKAFRQAGFSGDQLETILASVGFARAKQRSRRA
jgi:hypothetical protein